MRSSFFDTDDIVFAVRITNVCIDLDELLSRHIQRHEQKKLEYARRAGLPTLAAKSEKHVLENECVAKRAARTVPPSTLAMPQWNDCHPARCSIM